MKIIANPTRTTVIVELSISELAKIQGISTTDIRIDKVFKGEYNGQEYQLDPKYDEIETVKNVPSEIRKCINQIKNLQTFLEKAENVAVTIDQMNIKK